MASILRQIVAGPRARHPEAGLDLCYMTDNIVVTSGPSSVWPKKAYRNPTDQLVAFLDRKHGGDWSIFEFRAEGTGYPDSEVYHRIHHFPWPDHHPPPFAIMPNLMAAMRNWIQRLDEVGDNHSKKKRVAVVHCKAGKGRSGTVACSYLISEEGWNRAEALQRFTDRRMRVGFGNGVSIPSQLRWVDYVDRWTNKMGKRYVERPVEVVEIHVWGLRDGAKVAIEGFIENGRKIENFHTFTRQEKTIVDEGNGRPAKMERQQNSGDLEKETLTSRVEETPETSTTSSNNANNAFEGSIQSVILKPSSPVILPTSDINVDFERRNKTTSSYTGFTMVTSIAHVWFNAYFEGGHEGHDSGVFEIEWDAMDGIKGSARKGIKALDRLKVVWRYAQEDTIGIDGSEAAKVITEPARGEPVPESEPADWRGEEVESGKDGARHSDGVDSGRPGGSLLTMGAMIQSGASSITKELGLRKEDPGSTNISRAPSLERLADAVEGGEEDGDVEEHEGVQARGPNGEDLSPYGGQHDDFHPEADPGEEGRRDTKVGQNMESGMSKISHAVGKMKGPLHENGHE